MSVSFAPNLRFDRRFAFVSALMVLALGLVIGALNERALSRQELTELDTQARILAQGVAAPVMFSDAAAAREHAAALAENPKVDAVGVYDQAGVLIASFQREGADRLPANPSAEPVSYHGAFLDTVRPVGRDGETYGHVYLRLRREPLLSRLGRYAPIALLMLMTALVLAIAGTAQDALVRARDELERRAADLATANRSLEAEIEQRRDAEEALVQSRKMEAIGQLTGGVAHDFNNLLMVVSGGLRMLSRHEEPERRRSIMEAMSQAVERGAGLTRQLLAFARRQPVQLQTVAIDSRISGMRPLLERSLRADILLDLNIPADLPPIKTDPGQFELAVLNLCVNARDAMPKGGVIAISAKRSGDDMVDLLVRDTGGGIAAEILNRIFEPYFTTKPVGQGTGLGLSQVYGFAQQSGGAVRIESKVGVGTTAILTLPVSDERVDAPTPALASAAVAHRGYAVLVVEDDDHVASTVCAMFEELGHKPRRVSSVDEALGLLEAPGQFDLVFSDIVMPGGKSGIDLAREVERSGLGVPLLLTTGYSGREEVEAGRPILRKPYEIKELEAAIATIFQREAA
jgi:signal transduction histidine kinase